MHTHENHTYWNRTDKMCFCSQTTQNFLGLGLPTYFNSSTEDIRQRQQLLTSCLPITLSDTNPRTQVQKALLALRAYLRDEHLIHIMHVWQKQKATQHLLPEFAIASVPDLIILLESRTCTLLFSHRPWWLQEVLGTTLTVPPSYSVQPVPENRPYRSEFRHHPHRMLFRMLLRIGTNFTPFIQILYELHQ